MDYLYCRCYWALFSDYGIWHIHICAFLKKGLAWCNIVLQRYLTAGTTIGTECPFFFFQNSLFVSWSSPIKCISAYIWYLRVQFLHDIENIYKTIDVLMMDLVLFAFLLFFVLLDSNFPKTCKPCVWCWIFSNYWMRLSRIWRILQVEEGVIHRGRGPRADLDNILRDLQNSSYSTKAEFNNCLIIHSKYFQTLKGENELYV